MSAQVGPLLFFLLIIKQTVSSVEDPAKARGWRSLWVCWF